MSRALSTSTCRFGVVMLAAFSMLAIAFFTWRWREASRSGLNVPTLVLTSSELSLGGLCVVDPDKCASTDDALRRTLMYEVLSPDSAGASSVNMGMFTSNGYLSTSMPRYKPRSALLCDITFMRRQHNMMQEGFVSEMLKSQMPLRYAKIAGQSAGECGILFCDNGWGTPTTPRSPRGILCHSWSRLQELVTANIGKGTKQLFMIQTAGSYTGDYSIVGFRTDEIPQWARDMLTVQQVEKEP